MRHKLARSEGFLQMRRGGRLLTAALLAMGALAGCQSAEPDGREDGSLEPPSEVIELRQQGLIANYYPAKLEGTGGPGLLMLGGSEGGLSDGVADEAEALRAEGISVLQLSFYRFDGQPQNLENIPLETFDRGLEWLSGRSEVDAGRIGVYGTSKGAEAALITASRHPELEAVVAIVPSSVSWQGINWDFDERVPTASWTLNGEPYPALPYGAFDYRTGVYSLYANGLEAVGDHPEAVIAVEKTDAPMLLVCGGADALWPSCPMAEAIKERADAAGHAVTLLAYPEAGHGAGGRPADTLDPATKDDTLDWGGTPATNNAAKADSWPRIVAFLKHEL